METKNENANLKWPEPRQYKKSIRVEFLIYVSVIILSLMFITGLVITDRYVTSVSQSVVEKLIAQARSYSSQAGKHIVSNENPDALLLTNICSKLTTDNADIYWAGISDQDNIFIAHSDLKQVIVAKRMVPVSSGQFAELLSENENLELRSDSIFVTVPINENGVTVGKLGLASSVRQINEARNTSIITVVTITLIMIIIGLPLTMFLLNRKLRPIGAITEQLKRVSLDNPDFDIHVAGKNELGYLAATLRVMGAKLNLAQKELVEKERIASELEIAREIQNNILPQKYPVTPAYEFAGSYRSAKEVGGDYYDFIEVGNSLPGFLVADVSGKSLPGMLVMLLTRDIVRRCAARTDSPAELLQMVNRELLPNIKKGMFVTMFVGVLDPKTGLFRFASAGHNPLIHIPGDSGSFRLIKTKGFPLGMMQPDQFDPRMEEGRIALNDNDWLIQYTDGINEAKDSNDNEYGMENFVETILSYISSSPKALVAGVMSQHASFVDVTPQFDDITLLAMKWQNRSTKQKTGQANEAAYAG
jgi:sigma-B regulation protein RsbU (phosphoserine phosphatase)